MSKTKLRLNRGDKMCYRSSQVRIVEYQVKIIDIFDDNSVIVEYLDGECKGERVWLDHNEASLGLLQLK